MLADRPLVLAIDAGSNGAAGVGCPPTDSRCMVRLLAAARWTGWVHRCTRRPARGGRPAETEEEFRARAYAWYTEGLAAKNAEIEALLRDLLEVQLPAAVGGLRLDDEEPRLSVIAWEEPRFLPSEIREGPGNGRRYRSRTITAEQAWRSAAVLASQCRIIGVIEDMVRNILGYGLPQLEVPFRGPKEAAAVWRGVQTTDEVRRLGSLVDAGEHIRDMTATLEVGIAWQKERERYARRLRSAAAGGVE
jgi:hypothetical protein